MFNLGFIAKLSHLVQKFKSGPVSVNFNVGQRGLDELDNV